MLSVVFSPLTIADAVEKLHCLSLHIPRVADHAHQANSKWSCRNSDEKPLKTRPHQLFRCTYVFQCICGSDHAQARHKTKKRQMPYQNIGCLAFAKLVGTFDGDEASRKCPSYISVHLLTFLQGTEIYFAFMR